MAIAGIGVDSVEIERFLEWANYPKKTLLKIFTDTEIAYCVSNTAKSAERFAARFATKEACFKALSQLLPEHKVPFLSACKYISIKSESNGNPQLIINWKHLLALSGKEISKSPIKSHISITHTQTVATALVILEYSQ